MKKIIFIISVSFFISTIYSQWQQVDEVYNGRIYSFTYNGTYIFYSTAYYGVIYSSNNGSNWNQTALNNRTVYSLTSNGPNIFAGTFSNGIYKSTNNGLNWNQTSLSTISVLALSFDNPYIFAGGEGGFYRSPDNGLSWIPMSFGSQAVNTISSQGTNVFAGTAAGTFSYGLKKSPDYGGSWIQTPMNYMDFYSTAVSNPLVIAGSEYRLYLSTNLGTNWSSCLENHVVRGCAISNSDIIAGTDDSGFYFSSNYGADWINKNEGFSPLEAIYSLTIANNYVFAGTGSGKVWRRPLYEILKINKFSTETPGKFLLNQNYPNPFNPSTKIKFSVPSSITKSNIKLTVFNVLGQEITTLMNEKLSPGEYEVNWSADNYPSGVYIYKLETDSFTDTKKMILMR